MAIKTTKPVVNVKGSTTPGNVAIFTSVPGEVIDGGAIPGSGGTPTAVVPTSISGLKLWLKADAGVYKDAGITPAIDGDTIQQWNDQSGNGNHVSQATLAKQPTYKTSIKNGLPVVRFNGAHCLTLASIGISTHTLLIVFKNSAASAVFVELGPSVSTNDGFMLLSTTTSVTVRKGGVVSSRNYSAGWGETDGYMLSGQHYNGAHSMHYALHNGTFNPGATATGNAPGSSTTTAALNIGSRNNATSNFTTGDICEILLYSPAISLQNVRALIQYLQQRWDV